MFIVLLLKSLINKGSERFPPNLDCPQRKKELRNDKTLLHEFSKYDKIYTMGGNFSTGLGYYQCYCEDAKFESFAKFFDSEN
jgi:hypothetical protein